LIVCACIIYHKGKFGTGNFGPGKFGPMKNIRSKYTLHYFVIFNKGN